MKAKFISEDLNFQRGLDPKQALQVGRYSPAEMSKERMYFVDKLGYEFGIAVEEDLVNENVWSYKLRYTTTKLSEYTVSDFKHRILYSPLPDIFLKKYYKGADFPDKILAPWVIVTEPKYEGWRFFSFDNKDDLIRKILEIEYHECESWDYLRIMENTINFLKSK